MECPTKVRGKDSLWASSLLPPVWDWGLKTIVNWTILL